MPPYTAHPAPKAPAAMSVLPESWHQRVQRIAAAAECDSQGMVLVVSGIVVGAPGLGAMGMGAEFWWQMADAGQ